MLFLSDGSLTALLNVQPPGRLQVDWQLASADLTGAGLDDRVRGEEAQPGVARRDLLQGPVCQGVHPEEVGLAASSEQGVVSL